MNAILKFVVIIVSLCILLGLHSCHDKCKDAKPSSITFTMHRNIFDTPYLISSGDTVRKGVSVTFAADVGDAVGISLEWKVGTDSRVFKEKQFTLEFDVKETIEIRLIAKRQPDLECFPLDDGIDTTYQVFTLVDTTLISGRYLGYNKSNPSDLFNVTFVDDRVKDRRYLDNLPKGCIKDDTNWFRNSYGLAGYDTAAIGEFGDSPKSCPGIYGVAQLSKDRRTLTIQYTYWDENTKKYLNDQFVGTKN